jgi:hypothetical protein
VEKRIIELFPFSCHSRAGGNPVVETTGIPAFRGVYPERSRRASAGMTSKLRNKFNKKASLSWLIRDVPIK